MSRKISGDGKRAYGKKTSQSELCKLELYELQEEKVLSTKKLWEEVFFQDSREFVDYYYKYKAKGNIAFVLKYKEDIISMVHLTPYKAVLRGDDRKESMVSYIVGVATKEAYRHKGCMKKLLYESFFKLYERKEPFAFLMPAAPEIYRSFSFTYIYERKNYSLHPKYLKDEAFMRFVQGKQKSYLFWTEAGEEYRIRLAADKDKKKLKAFAKRVLQEQYDFYLDHTEQYFEVLLKEIESQKGGIFLIEKQEKTVSYFVCAMDQKQPYIQELLFLDQKGLHAANELFIEEKKKQPIIMARIIRVEEMLSLLESREEKELLLEIEDKDISFNQGSFQWKVGKGWSRVKRLKEPEREFRAAETETVQQEESRLNKKCVNVSGAKVIKVSIKELTEQIFTGKCGNIALEKAWNGISVYKNGIVNEIV